MVFTKYCYVLLTLFFPVFDRQPEYADHQMMSTRNIHIMTVGIDFVTSAKKSVMILNEKTELEKSHLLHNYLHLFA